MAKNRTCECGQPADYFSKKKKKRRADNTHTMCEDCWEKALKECEYKTYPIEVEDDEF